MLHAVLFDFHNTLVSSDAWLDLEIHTLPRQVLQMLVRDGVLPAAATPDDLLRRADELYKQVREEAKESGLEVSAGAGARRVLDQLGLESVTQAEIDRAVEEAEQACLAGSADIPGARQAVEDLRGLGLHLGVVSSAAYPQFVEWGLAWHGMDHLFEVVATSAATGYYKSDPRLYQYALSRLGVEPGAAVHIGDHLRFDVQGAQRAGLRAIWYNPTNAPVSGDIKPDGIITAMQELPGALATLEDKQ